MIVNRRREIHVLLAYVMSFKVLEEVRLSVYTYLSAGFLCLHSISSMCLCVLVYFSLFSYFLQELEACKDRILDIGSGFLKWVCQSGNKQWLVAT